MSLNRLAIKTCAAALGASLWGVSGAAIAQGNPSLEEYRIETEHCLGCGEVQFDTVEEAQAYMAQVGAALADGAGAGDWVDGYYNGLLPRDEREPQVVFLDFDAGGLPTFPVCFTFGAVFGVFQDHFYTPEEREFIRERFEDEYKEFNFEFVTEEPTHGDYSTVFFGQNDAPLDCSQGSNIQVTPTGGVSILFGQAESIDFLNRNRADNAFADASLWEFLAQLDPSGGLFQAFSGIDPADFGGNLQLAVSEAVKQQTANTGAHELGHLQGLRHQNSFGAPGDGIPSTGVPGPNAFVPVFDGGQNATETVLHTMASGASVGLSLSGSVMDRFFSERSAARLAINEQAKIEHEWRIRQNGQRDRVNLDRIKVPNTIVEGENVGAKFKVDALIIKGDIETLGEIDSYIFRGKKGEFLNAELVSVIGEGLTFEEGIMGQLRLYHIDNRGNETLIASNLQSFESLFDAEIFDAELPENAFYRIEVSAPDEFFPADVTGDGVLDPFPISTAGGAPELLTGRYSLQVYTSDTKLNGRAKRFIVAAN